MEEAWEVAFKEWTKKNQLNEANKEMARTAFEAGWNACYKDCDVSRKSFTIECFVKFLKEIKKDHEI